MVERIFVLFLLYFPLVFGDLPIHCLHGEVSGKWKFEVSKAEADFHACGYRAPDQNAEHFKESTYNFISESSFEVELAEPNIVHTEDRKGVWTMVYDEGFEARIEDESYFAFHKYEPRNTAMITREVSDYVSYCDQTMTGWFHNIKKDKWGCWRGTKVASESTLQMSQKFKKMKFSSANIVSPRSLIEVRPASKSKEAFVQKINSDPNSKWKATIYPMFEDLSSVELGKRLGATKWIRKRTNHVRSFIDLRSDEVRYGDLPKHWDWRDVNGENFDSPVKNQGGCGSCYAFAAASALEARTRVASGNRLKPSFSVQNILDCSIWNQACDGGYPYLVARHAQVFGLVDEKCAAYQGVTRDCDMAKFFITHQSPSHLQEMTAFTTDEDVTACAKRYYVQDYKYVGGYYGATNEVEMMKEIKEHGPVTVAFQAPSELFSYQSGVFDYTSETPHQIDQHIPNVNIWEQTNHAVVAVGWGELDDGTKYWILKNTWGDTWGEKGYFRFLRGKDLCAVESMAVTATVILPE